MRIWVNSRIETEGDGRDTYMREYAALSTGSVHGLGAESRCARVAQGIASYRISSASSVCTYAELKCM